MDVWGLLLSPFDLGLKPFSLNTSIHLRLAVKVNLPIVATKVHYSVKESPSCIIPWWHRAWSTRTCGITLSTWTHAAINLPFIVLSFPHLIFCFTQAPQNIRIRSCLLHRSSSLLCANQHKKGTVDPHPDISPQTRHHEEYDQSVIGQEEVQDWWDLAIDCYTFR